MSTMSTELEHPAKYKFNEEVKGKKTEALIEVISAFFQPPIKDALVVGCGSGLEAGMLARAFSANVIGIDVGNDFIFDHKASAPAQLLMMDARSQVPGQFLRYGVFVSRARAHSGAETRAQ